MPVHIADPSRLDYLNRTLVALLLCLLFSLAFVAVASFASYGTSGGPPINVAVDSQGNLYFARNSPQAIVKLDQQGQVLASWGKQGSRPGQFQGAAGIALDSQDNLYVADEGNSRIQKFDQRGNFLTSWITIDPVSGEDQSPQGIVVDPSTGEVIISYFNYRIQKFDSSGKLLFTLNKAGTGPGELEFTLSQLALDGQGNFYVADRNNSRIQKFDPAGKFLASFGSYGKAEGELSYPQGVAVDPLGNIFIADTDNRRIVKLTSEGKMVKSWDGGWPGPNRLYYPQGIALDKANNFYVSDTHNHIIKKFEQSGQLLAEWHFPTLERPPEIDLVGVWLVIGLEAIVAGALLFLVQRQSDKVGPLVRVRLVLASLRLKDFNQQLFTLGGVTPGGRGGLSSNILPQPLVGWELAPSKPMKPIAGIKRAMNHLEFWLVLLFYLIGLPITSLILGLAGLDSVTLLFLDSLAIAGGLISWLVVLKGGHPVAIGIKTGLALWIVLIVITFTIMIILAIIALSECTSRGYFCGP